MRLLAVSVSAGAGHECMVVSPSMTPRRAARSHQDRPARRDEAGRLARAGELARSTYPTRPMRRCATWCARGGRGGHAAPGAAALRAAAAQRDTLPVRRLDRGASALDRALKLAQPAQQIAFEEYVQAVRKQRRVQRLSSHRQPA